MIDTDKYEGHTEGPWGWFSSSTLSDADKLLMTDAPLLLAEVKQLRTDIADLVICLDLSQCPSWFMMKYNEMAQTMWKEGKTWYGQREEGEEE